MGLSSQGKEKEKSREEKGEQTEKKKNPSGWGGFFNKKRRRRAENVLPEETADRPARSEEERGGGRVFGKGRRQEREKGASPSNLEDDSGWHGASLTVDQRRCRPSETEGCIISTAGGEEERT